MDDFEGMSSSLLQNANATAPLYEFLGTVPGFDWLQGLIAQWVKLDIRMLAAALTILGTLSGVLHFLNSMAIKLYWYITRFCTASISINARDKLNREVLNWVGAQVLTRQGARIVTARSEEIDSDAYDYYRARQDTRIDYLTEKRKPIQYLPTFGSTWFLHAGNIFIVRRVSVGSSGFSFMDSEPDEFASAPEGTEPLVIMCLGRSVAPIKRFLDTCREFAEKQREAYVTVRISKSRYDDETWETTILRPLRPIETIHFDEKAKVELLADVKNYLDPATRKFYNQRGIPYRRGYLLHGPAGTGKTSLSLALAGLFGLELYLLHVPSVQDDRALEKLFTALPPQCFILLEDIDAVGIKNRVSNYDDDKDDDGSDFDDDVATEDRYPRARVTLSGLLNVLDGVSSQEGRIVLMTSNFAERLDRALVRPGRIDRMIFLGHIAPQSAELMFKRMYERDPTTASSSISDVKIYPEEQLEELAREFGAKIKKDTFTPAQLQGYLLINRSSPRDAVDGLDKWMQEEIAQMEDAKKRAEQVVAARRRRRKKQRQLNVVMNPHMGMMAPVVPSAGLLGPQQVAGVDTPPVSATKETYGGDADEQPAVVGTVS